MYIILYYSQRYSYMHVIEQYTQGVSYSQKFHSKRSFPKLVNNGTSQFRFYEYLIEYQNVKN